MQYYYRYIFKNKDLKKLNVWDYSHEITSALKTHYQSSLIEVDFSSSHYGFWLNRIKGPTEHSKVGKKITSLVPDFNKYKSTYSYLNNDGTKGKSTQIFIEDEKSRKSR
ncbi:hypothetical protein ACSXEQ_06205 [Clostridium perfringens]|uniref:hypothetical protein n=1 Tax=Clostridium perfringens TaxID=1502 RepID=UPI003CECA57B